MPEVHDNNGFAGTGDRPSSHVDQQKSHGHIQNHNNPESTGPKLPPTKNGQSSHGSPGNSPNHSRPENPRPKLPLALNGLSENGSPQLKTSDASLGVFDGVSEPKSASEAFSMILDSVGSDGRWQWYLFFITAICGNFTALHNLGAVFLAAEPQHWCDVPGLEEFQNQTQGRDLRNASIPWEVGLDGTGRFSRCRYFIRDYAAVVDALPEDPNALVQAPPSSTPTTTCRSWHYDTSIYASTIVSEWDLVCEDRWLMSSAQASYMVGFMLGALVLSELADKFGRRTMLLWSTVFFSVATIATSFSSSYFMFLAMRLFVAAFGSGIFLSNFVILMESLGLHSRTRFGVLYHIFFSTGMCTLALLAYLFRDWRHLMMATSFPTLTLLVYFIIIPESPRWLMMEGRHEEALVVLSKMARFNKRALLPQHSLELCIKTIDRERSEEHRTSFRDKCLTFMHSQATLVRTPNMRRRCLIIFFAWFVVSMIYYGLAFNGGNLNLPPYLLMAISGLVEVAACFFNIWILNVCGRRISLCILLVVCGVACLVIVFIPVELSWVNLVLSSVGRFFISPGFNVVFMYSAELVPTHVRNVAVGTSSMCARIGSGIAPYIVDLLGAIHYAVPSAVFGGFAVTSGLLSLLLPETGNQRLPESVMEIESMPR